MSLVNCGQCGKLIVENQLRLNLCEDCFAVQEAEFAKIKETLRRRPNANIMQLSESTGISPAKIMHWIREGRIHLEI
jgi:predicted dinucleotide-utilizing enzyme